MKRFRTLQSHQHDNLSNIRLAQNYNIITTLSRPQIQKLMSHCIDKAELCTYNESCNRYCNLTVLYITANNVLLPSAVKREYGSTEGQTLN